MHHVRQAYHSSQKRFCHAAMGCVTSIGTAWLLSPACNVIYMRKCIFLISFSTSYKKDHFSFEILSSSPRRECLFPIRKWCMNRMSWFRFQQIVLPSTRRNSHQWFFHSLWSKCDSISAASVMSCTQQTGNHEWKVQRGGRTHIRRFAQGTIYFM